MMADGFNHWGQIANALPKVASQIVRKAAFDIQAQAASRAPVDTGFLKNSIYTVTADSSTYKGGDKSLPEVETPENDQTAYVAVGAEYGIYVEMGTRFAPAQPYFYPAVDAVKPGFDAALSAIEGKLREAAR
jgi:HK97 gp10 family phage protein